MSPAGTGSRISRERDEQDYQLPNSPERDSDHELTTNAYTDSNDSDDSDSDVGHHTAYDDEAEEQDAASEATTNSNPPEIAAETAQEERTGVEERAEEEEERIEIPSRRGGLRRKQDPSYQYGFGFTQTSGDKSAPKLPPVGVTWKDKQPTSAALGAPRSEEKLPEAAEVQNARKAIFGLVFTQMSAKTGIKKHGQAAVDALRKEFEQFRSMDVLEPLDAFKLTREQKAESLRALSVIEQKRNGLLKGRTVADGSSQKGKYPKEQTGSPTISNDALFMTILVDAHENRDVATADITGAYLHAHMKDFVTMRFTGWAVDLLC